MSNDRRRLRIRQGTDYSSMQVWSYIKANAPCTIPCDSEREAKRVRMRLYVARQQMLPEQQGSFASYVLSLFERDGIWHLEASDGDDIMKKILKRAGGTAAPEPIECPEDQPEPLSDEWLDSIQELSDARQKERAASKSELPNPDGDLSDPKTAR